MKPIATERLIIRNWEERDRDLFYRINSDEAVMEFFPFRRNRGESDRFFDELRARIAEKGFGFTALELRETGECVGFAGLHADSVVPSLPAETIEIGWRLAPEHWGKGYVTEAAEALFRHGFEEMGDEIVDPDTYAELVRSRDEGIAERLDLARVTPNTLGNSRLVKQL